MKTNYLRSISMLCAIILLLFAITGCGEKQDKLSEDNAGVNPEASTADFPVTLVDSLKREIVVEAKPDKIISLSPAITEILFAIGAHDQIVGVTDYCEYPAEALEKPRVGSFENPNLELIINSEPDIIFIAAGIQEEFIKQFEDLGIKVVTLDATTVSEVLGNIEIAGMATGNTKKSSELVTNLEQRVQAVEDKLADIKNRPSVFFEVWDDPLMTAGPGSFIDDLITLAGGTNIASDAAKKFTEFNREVLLSRNPEIYIINSHAHTPEEIKNRVGYDGLKAVINNRVYSINDDLVTLPGPRLIEGLEEMAKVIHPELF